MIDCLPIRAVRGYRRRCPKPGTDGDKLSASAEAARLGTVLARDWAGVATPAHATGSESVSAAINVVAAVVFPIPISPAISRSAPASTSSSAIRRPASMADASLFAGQRVFDGDVSAAPPHLVRTDRRRQRLFGIDRDVDHPYGGPGRLGQRVDRGTARVEVRDHLRRDLRRVCRDPHRGDAVVAREHHHAGPRKLPRRAHALSTKPPRSTGLRVVRVSRAVWSTGPGGPARPRRYQRSAA